MEVTSPRRLDDSSCMGAPQEHSVSVTRGHYVRLGGHGEGGRSLLTYRRVCLGSFKDIVYGYIAE